MRDVVLTPQSIWKPVYSVFRCGRDQPGIDQGHQRTLADSKHPFHRTLFGTPRTAIGDPVVHSTARLSLDVPALYGHN